MLSGDNGILKRATIAKENTDNSQIQERINLAYHSALVDGQGEVTETSLENELKNEFNKSTLEDRWIDKTSIEGKWKITIDGISLEVPAGKRDDTRASILDDKTIAEKKTNPWKPEGTTVTENDITKGITVSKGDTEWSWVIVPFDVTANAEGDVAIEAALRTYCSNNGVTKRYVNYKDDWYAMDDNTVITEETSNLTDEQKALKNGCGLTYEKYMEKKSKMLNSIKTYGGFWIGKYEVGADNFRTAGNKGNTSTHMPVIKPDKYPYTYITCSEAEDLAETLTSGMATTKDAKGSLLFGIQWDLTLVYLKLYANPEIDPSNSTNWGNYKTKILVINSENAYGSTNPSHVSRPIWNRINKNSNSKADTSTKILLTTGAAEDTTNILNIVDLAGNVEEWTLENSHSSTGTPCILRGGKYSNQGSGVNYAAISYTSTNPLTSDYDHGFRPSFY